MHPWIDYWLKEKGYDFEQMLDILVRLHKAGKVSYEEASEIEEEIEALKNEPHRELPFPIFSLMKEQEKQK